MQRHKLIHGRLAAVLFAAIVAAIVPACGGSDHDAKTDAQHTTTKPAADQSPLPLPGPGDLNAGLTLALDPNTPREQKIGAVQGADVDPDLIDKMTQAGAANKVTMTITKVEYVGAGVMQASATLTLNGKPVEGQAQIPFVAEGGRWKLQKAWACQMLANAQLTSSACQ
ncbi:hypothetical protein [Nocardia xishanensis]|uniref:hypothetical protein n=1 Tax=Nocardia xishanensis TaxID=238964 RepID=UPI0008378DE3|nr:hypothetical protein [Nocardia xishanensis]